MGWSSRLTSIKESDTNEPLMSVSSITLSLTLVESDLKDIWMGLLPLKKFE